MTGVALLGGKNLVTVNEYGIIYPTTSSDALTLDYFVGRCIHTEGLLPPFTFFQAGSSMEVSVEKG